MAVHLNDNLSDQLAANRAFQEKLLAQAQRIVPAAQALAPVDSGAYRNSIEAIIVGDRVVVKASGDTPQAGWIEFGTQHTPAFAPLRRGAESAGFRVVGRER